MASMVFENVTIQYPIYGNHAMELRNQLLRITTGGIIEKKSSSITLVTALKNISFSLSDGDSVGIIGHNGAGKSTLLRAMAGIYQPSSGRITTSGKIATVFDIGAGLEPELSGYDNIINLGIMLGLTINESKKLTSEIEEFTELGEFLNLPVKTYSSGMTMRLMFAVATSISPEILLVDEMLSTGDNNFQEKSQIRIRKLIKSSKIFVIASHDWNLVNEYCNKIFHLEHGYLEIKKPWGKEKHELFHKTKQ
jgi:ABC-type polysaccharide/polyol phosphate transport system ATPase subunit